MPTEANHCTSRCPSVAPRKRSGQHTVEGDPDLDGREELARIGRECKRPAGPHHFAVDPGLQTSASRRHDRKLRHRKDAVEHNQRDNDHDFDEQHRKNIDMQHDRRGRLGRWLREMVDAIAHAGVWLQLAKRNSLPLSNALSGSSQATNLL